MHEKLKEKLAGLWQFVKKVEHAQKNRKWTFPVVRYFKWKLESVSNILWMIVG